MTRFVFSKNLNRFSTGNHYMVHVYLRLLVKNMISFALCQQIRTRIKRNIRVHNKDLKSTAYKTMVRPQLEYVSREGNGGGRVRGRKGAGEGRKREGEGRREKEKGEKGREKGERGREKGEKEGGRRKKGEGEGRKGEGEGKKGAGRKGPSVPHSFNCVVSSYSYWH